MLKVVATCLVFQWALGDIPESWPLDHWDAYLDGEIYATEFPIVERQVEICVPDDQPHTLQVVARFTDGRSSDRSDASLAYTFPQPQHTIPLPLLVRADLNGDGIQDIADFGLFARSFGKCNEVLAEVPCE